MGALSAASEQMTVLWNLVEVMLAISSIVQTTEKASPVQDEARTREMRARV